MNMTIDELCGASYIANVTGLTKKTVQNHYVNRSDFPRPVKTPRGRRWVKDEVHAWWSCNIKRSN